MEITSTTQRPWRALGRGLGWFSIGLGLTELVAPRGVARLVGVSDDGKAPAVIRMYGVRELIAGALLLARPTSPTGGWSRVAGDLVDLTSIGLAMRHRRANRARNVFALGSVLAVTALDVLHGMRETRRKLGDPVRGAVTIGKPAEEVYAMWKRYDRFPQFMHWVESIEKKGDGISHWKVKTPAGVSIEFDSRVTEDVPNRRIAWESLPGTVVPNRGRVEFRPAPGGRGTEAIVEMQLAAPLGKMIASAELDGDLRRLKQILELGEVVVSDATVRPGLHPAQPEGDVR